MSYHLLTIHKHDVGSPYKLQEEFLEYIDAVASGNPIMAVQELSDLYGCLQNEVEKYGMTMDDLKVMSDTTKKVFNSGVRQSEDLLTMLKREHDSILSWGLGFIQVKCGDINYNFYHREVQRFKSADAPHSHQQDFVSEIIKGEITETFYDTFDGDNFAYCGCGNTNRNKFLGYEESDVFIHNKGSLYLRLNNEFHSVVAEHGTVTKVVKYGSKTDAYVIAEEYDSEIQHIPEVACWRMVKEVLNV